MERRARGRRAAAAPAPPTAAAPAAAHPLRVLTALGLATLAFSLAQTMNVPSIGTLARELDTDVTGATWTVTAYLLPAAVATPVVGRLGDMFGRRRLLTIALAIFTLGSVIAALGSTLPVVIAGRALQGVSGGVFPLCYAIAREALPRGTVARGIAVLSSVLAVGGALGIVLGGLLLDYADYHWIFWSGAILGTLGIAAARLGVPDMPGHAPGRVDVRGALLFGAGILPPLIAISNAHRWGWASPRVLALLATGLLLLAGWLALQARTAEPLVHLPTLLAPTVLLTNLATVLVGLSIFGSFLLVPQLLQMPAATGYGFGLTATQSGLAMLPGALVAMGASLLAGRISRRRGSHVPLIAGGLSAAAGLAVLAGLHASVAVVIAGYAIASVGVGLTTAALPDLIMRASPRERAGEATGFNAVMRSVGSSVGSQLVATILASSVVAGTLLPRESGFTAAFLVLAAGALGVGAIGALIPWSAGRARR